MEKRFVLFGIIGMILLGGIVYVFFTVGKNSAISESTPEMTILPTLTPTSMPSNGNSRSPKTLNDIIIGTWEVVGASDQSGNEIVDWSNNPEWGSRTRDIEIRFDDDGKFYQRRWTNNTGYETDSDWNEWENEGIYTVNGNNVTFKLNNVDTDQILFWRNSQTEVGVYLLEKGLLQYRTNHYEGGDVVYYYFQKQ